MSGRSYISVPIPGMYCRRLSASTAQRGGVLAVSIHIGDIDQEYPIYRSWQKKVPLTSLPDLWIASYLGIKRY